jgi:hypothetical protein
MKYQGIRNSIVSGLGEGNFGQPLPGSITSLWLDLNLTAEDYADSIVLYQIAFDVIQPGGSSLCFTDTPLEYEFVSYYNDVDESLDEIYIHDDCRLESLVIINPTATDDPKSSAMQVIDEVYLNSYGTLAFNSLKDQTLRISLCDLTGTQIVSFAERQFGEGRHKLQCKILVSGIYVLKAIGEDGREQVMKVFAY